MKYFFQLLRCPYIQQNGPALFKQKKQEEIIVGKISQMMKNYFIKGLH
jgi:hypothetical protein